MAHLLHIIMSLLKTCRSLSRICRCAARTLLERNSSPCDGFGTCAFEIIGAGWRCFLPSEAIFTNIKARVAGVIFVLALFAATLWISLSHTWKQTMFLKADTLPASFIIYVGPEKHFTVNYPPPPQRFSVFLYSPFRCHSVYPTHHWETHTILNPLVVFLCSPYILLSFSVMLLGRGAQYCSGGFPLLEEKNPE